MQTWRLDDARQSLVLSATDGRLPQVIYWGASLPDDEDLATLHDVSEIDLTGGMLDENPDLSVCPEAIRSFPGQPGMDVRRIDGTMLLPRFSFANAIHKQSRLLLHYWDQDNELGLQFAFTHDAETQVITCQTQLTSETPVRLHWLAAPVVPAPQHSDEMIDFSGRWCGEFQTNNVPWSAGIRLRENRTGRTGHEHFPGLMVPCAGATNTMGEAYAFHYGWSGGHRMVAEELPDGRRQIQWGHATGIENQAGTHFTTAPLYLTYSNAGLNGCAIGFQRHVRDRIVTWPKPNRPRPVHYNCWEAVYFDHKQDELCDIADRAAALGAERFVLDDGWFGQRDDDTSALSDWVVDPRKYPDGLGPLIAHVHSTGMTFGLWFEPEMINSDSDIYRAHPDWVLGDIDQVLGRQQMVLNMALPDVQNYLYDRMALMLDDHDIDYIKWDHNRVLPTPDAAQTRGTYALLDRLRADFPMVEIESCSSGGGRIDFGILERTQRVWLSDSNDALERLQIQHNAALFLPLSITGSHVGPRHCHTSGRTFDISFRAWVAAQRHMGFEMDPRELTEAEMQTLTRVTTWWKNNRHWMERADILRLDSTDSAIIAEQQLAADGSQFVVFAGKAGTSTQIAPRPLRLTQLQGDAMYNIRLVNRDDTHHLSRGTPMIKDQDINVSGTYLMHHGLVLPWAFPDTMWVAQGERL